MYSRRVIFYTIFLVDKFLTGQPGLWPLQTNLFARISFDIILYKNTHAYTHSQIKVYTYTFESLKKLVIQRIRQIWVTCPVLFMMGCKTKGHVWTRSLFLTGISAIALRRRLYPAQSPSLVLSPSCPS